MTNATGASDRKMLTYALAFSAGLMVIKFLAYYLTQSNTILSDALESIVNVTAGVFALWSMALSLRPRDENHPYGHGKIEFISSGIEGALIIVAGVSIILKSATTLGDNKVLTDLDLGLLLIVVSGVLNYLVGFILMRKGVKSNSLILEANGKHLMTDAYSTLGIILGLVVIYFTDIFWLDDVFASIMGVLIIVTGIRIIRKSVAGVMDELDSDMIQQMVDQLNQLRKVEWIDVHNLRTIKFGQTIHVDCHLTLPWYWTIARGHKEIHELSKMMNERFPKTYEFFIHVDSCEPAMCAHCEIQCEHRQAPFIRQLEWTPEKLVKNKRLKT